MLSASAGKFGYHICEMSFLQRFAQDDAGSFQILKQHNPDTFSIVGGGMTSPDKDDRDFLLVEGSRLILFCDSLLPHGEAFIRNYLSGVRWLRSVGLEWSRTVWLPDDFGHDSQLPVLLEALGVKAVSFARSPGACNQGHNYIPSGIIAFVINSLLMLSHLHRAVGAKSAHQMLLDPVTGGLNFNWTSNDNSSVFSYYMPQHYCAGDTLIDNLSCEAASPNDAASCKCSVNATSPFDRIQVR